MWSGNIRGHVSVVQVVFLSTLDSHNWGSGTELILLFNLGIGAGK
jgi:hypothetical protein